MRALTPAVFFLLTFIVRASSPQYSVAVVPAPSGWSPTFLLPMAVNNLGQIVGYGTNPSVNTQTFFGTTAGTAAVPFEAGATVQYGSGINDSGQIVGSFNSSGSFFAYSGTATSVTPLPVLSGWTGSGAAAVNNSGEIVGTASIGPRVIPFIVSSGVISLIPLPSGWTDAYGTVINSSGLVGGFNPDLGGRAYLGTPSGTTVIPLPPGATGFADLSGLNDSGTAAGAVLIAPVVQAWVGNVSSGTLIPLPPGASEAENPHINNFGTVVGSSNVGGWIWDPINGTRLLNALVPSGYSIGGVLGINNQGQILATATAPGAGTVDLLLTPLNPPSTPAPPSIMMLMIGLGTLVLACRRFSLARR